MRRLRTKDQVVVLVGRDKGKRGTIVQVVAPQWCVVGGINRTKHYKKDNPMLMETGGVVELEAPIHVSKLALWNPSSGKADRVRYGRHEGRKVRFFRSDDTMVS
jgi:large subunit ribosomal protein L24